jgi:cell division protein FtsB
MTTLPTKLTPEGPSSQTSASTLSSSSSSARQSTKTEKQKADKAKTNHQTRLRNEGKEQNVKELTAQVPAFREKNAMIEAELDR